MFEKVEASFAEIKPNSTPISFPCMPENSECMTKPGSTKYSKRDRLAGRQTHGKGKGTGDVSFL